jgi:hypothetical protein
VAFEHSIANVAVKSFDSFVRARNVLFQRVTAIKRLSTQIADEITLIEMALKEIKRIN